jgi:hypothetical protein
MGYHVAVDLKQHVTVEMGHNLRVVYRRAPGVALRAPLLEMVGFSLAFCEVRSDEESVFCRRIRRWVIFGGVFSLVVFSKMS